MNAVSLAKIVVVNELNADTGRRRDSCGNAKPRNKDWETTSHNSNAFEKAHRSMM